MNKTLLDTDILSEVLKGRNESVVAQAQAYLGLLLKRLYTTSYWYQGISPTTVASKR